MLQPDDAGEWHPVSWWSKSLSPAEKEYSSTELECKALHDILMYYDVYLQGVQFDVFTDHAALIYMVRAQTASNNGRLMRYLMDIQHYNFRLFYKKGSMHLDADAVSRLLKFGEEPVYLNADDLEWDKGPVTEEEVLVAKDMAARRLRRIERSKERKLKIQAEKDGSRQLTDEEGQPTRFQPLTEEEKLHRKEVRCNGLLKQRPPPHSGYPLRKRSACEPTRVRTSPGVDTFDGLESPPSVQTMVQSRRCGYNRVRVVPSTIEGAGYGLFMAQPNIKAGGLITTYEGKRITRAEAEESDSGYIFETVTKEGTHLCIDARDETSCFGRYINDPRDDTLVNAKVVLKGGRLVVIATTDLYEGDEVFISYGAEYWSDKLELLDPADAEMFVRK